MLRRIKLYGGLAKFIGKRVLYADVANAAEAIRYLVANWPEVHQYMAEKHYRVFAGDWNLDLEELHAPAGEGSIKIVPVVGGAGSGAAKIFTGIAIIAAAIITGGIASAGVTLGGFLGIGTVATAFVVAGAGLVLAGTAQLLSPTPQLGGGGGAGGALDGGTEGGGSGLSDKKKRGGNASQNFNGIQNVSRQGLAIPLMYGEVATGSLVVSSAVDVSRKKRKRKN